ncbi:unnamed protein product [Meloidogyne enterolobii]|uniref:Uncharacterized protein n=1 Tax=Meloidogyne enterolobii TaxID=390850 RepID=A0ACB0XKS6_MELEN
MISPMALESLLEGVQNQDVNNTREGQQQQNQNNNFKFCKINEEEKIKENEQIINRKRKLSLNSSTNFDDFNENKNSNLVNSPNISFQQTILDLAQCEALKNKNNEEKDFNGKLEIGEEEEEERNNGDNSSNDLNRQRSQLLEFLEARKALERMFSQFVGHQKMFPPTSSPSSLPFQQQLADQLSPFLLALNNTNQQQQQLETINNNNNNIQSTSSTSTELLFSDSSFQNNPFFFPPWHQQKNFFQFSSEKLNKEEISNNSEIFNIDGPEDLTTTKDERESSTTTISELINNGQQQQQNWSYEDQFKQLYDLSEDTSRKEWLNDWLQFMHKIGKPVTRIPIMAKQVLDLYELYRLVVQHGGLVEVINKKLWREITKGLNLPPSITSAAFTLRTQYSKYLFDYECHRHNFSNIADLQAAVDGNKREGRKNPLPGTSTTTNSSSTPPSIQKQEQNLQQQQSPNSSQMFIIPPPSTNNCVTTAQIMVAAAAAATFGTFPSQSSFADLFGNLNNNLNLQQNILGSEDDGDNGDNLNINNEQQTFQQQLNNVLNAVSTKNVFNKFGLDFIKENDGEQQQQYLNLTPTIFNLPAFYSSNNDLNNIKNDQEFNSSFFSSTPHQHILTEQELIKNKEKSEPSIIKTTNNFKKQKRSQSVNTTINYLNKEEKINKTINENNKERILIKQRGKIKESSINVSLNLNGIIYKGILFACFNKNNLELNEKDDWEFLIKDENN